MKYIEKVVSFMDETLDATKRGVSAVCRQTGWGHGPSIASAADVLLVGERQQIIVLVII